VDATLEALHATPSPLAEAVARGKQLVLSAALVGDRDDFDVWWRRSRDWTKHIGDSLAGIYGEESARTFLAALPPSPKPGSWQLTLGEETTRSEEVLGLLDALTLERGLRS
jgi:hypothetical protein